jgi:plastocyanin
MRAITNPRRGTGCCGWMATAAVLLFVPSARAQEASVSGQIEIQETNAKNQANSAHHANAASNPVVWLVSLADKPESPSAQRPHGPAQLVQRNKSFEPHVLVVQVGSTVQFPNKDPFFHNVFSLFDGKRFDLGLYEAGSTNSVRFDRPGISFILCNIHPEMSAVIIAVPTSFFAVSDAEGRWTIPNVPNGRYRLHVWYERSSDETLAKMQSDVLLSDASRSLAVIRIAADAAPSPAHKNKYGKDYVPPSSPAYSNP